MASEQTPASSVLTVTEKPIGQGAAIDEVHDETEVTYATGLRLAVITMALCLSVFLMALVSLFHGHVVSACSPSHCGWRLNFFTGQHDHCNSDTPHNGRVRGAQ